MKIDLLLKRENALKIISDTLIKYWKKRYDLEIESSSSKKKSFELQINSKLNFISFRETNKEEFGVIKKEFGNGTNLLKLPLQQFYVFLACSRWFRSFFKTHHLFFKTNRKIEFNKQLIIGGNHRIRINSRKDGISTVILKEGFAESWMKNEINFRLSHQHLEELNLIAYDTNYTWFDEPFIEGTPCNRILQSTKREAIKKEALIYLKTKIAKPNLKEVYVREYWKTKIDNLLTRIHVINNFIPGIKEDLIELLGKLTATFSELKDNSKIYLTYTHGDFQPANILEVSGEMRIIDWEEVTIRTCYYDLIIWILDLRRKQLTNQELSKLYIDFSRLEEWLPTNLASWKDTCFLCFCLEEIIFRFNDYCNNSFYKSGNELSSILKETKQFIKSNYG